MMTTFKANIKIPTVQFGYIELLDVEGDIDEIANVHDRMLEAMSGTVKTGYTEDEESHEIAPWKKVKCPCGLTPEAKISPKKKLYLSCTCGLVSLDEGKTWESLAAMKKG